MNDDLIRSLERAVLDSPDDTVLRLHLAELLLAAGRAGAALDHCDAVLRMRPDDDAALRIAGQARQALTGTTAQTAAGLTDAQAGAPPMPERVTEDGEAAPSVDDLFDIVRPDVTLADVAGMEDVKERIQLGFLEPMRQPELRQAYGASLRRSLLLWGPPGCGKTFIAKALAGELGLYFIPIGVADVLDMWVGSSERNVHSLFETARTMAPAVVFIDELDALGRRRSQFSGNAAGRNVVNQLLIELDGVAGDNEGVFTLAATNQPWDVEPALVRPGRFDRMVFVAPPDAPARAKILENHLRNRPVGVLDIPAIVKRTEGFSGADLAHIADRATEFALHEAGAQRAVQPLEQRHLFKALDDITPSTAAWFATAKNAAQFWADDRYAELLRYLGKRRR